MSTNKKSTASSMKMMSIDGKIIDHTRVGGRLRIVGCAANEVNHVYKKK